MNVNRSKELVKPLRAATATSKPVQATAAAPRPPSASASSSLLSHRSSHPVKKLTSKEPAGSAQIAAQTISLPSTPRVPMVKAVSERPVSMELRTPEQLKEHIDYLRAVHMQWLFIRERGARAIDEQRAHTMHRILDVAAASEALAAEADALEADNMRLRAVVLYGQLLTPQYAALEPISRPLRHMVRAHRSLSAALGKATVKLPTDRVCGASETLVVEIERSLQLLGQLADATRPMAPALAALDAHTASCAALVGAEVAQLDAVRTQLSRAVTAEVHERSLVIERLQRAEHDHERDHERRGRPGAS